MTTRKRISIFVGAVIILLLGGQANAGLVTTTGVDSISSLGGTDSVDWSGVATAGSPVSSPFNADSGHGIQITVSETTGPFYVLQESSTVGSQYWNGNFSEGAIVLYTGTSSSPSAIGPITIDFSTPVSAVGAQIQQDAYGFFSPTIAAYDSSSNLLGTYTRTGAGNSNGNNDGSAIFIGIKSSSASPNISEVVFSLDPTTQDFAIGGLDFAGGQGGSAPEPATLALLTCGIVGLTSYRWCRRQRSTVAGCPAP